MCWTLARAADTPAGMRNPIWWFLSLLIGCASTGDGGFGESDEGGVAADGGFDGTGDDDGSTAQQDSGSTRQTDGGVHLPPDGGQTDGNVLGQLDGPLSAGDGGALGRTSIGWAVDYPDDVFDVIAQHK